MLTLFTQLQYGMFYIQKVLDLSIEKAFYLKAAYTDVKRSIP